MKPKDRMELLQQLVNFSMPLPAIVSSLSQMEWDSEPLVTLSHQAVKNVLQRYIAHEFNGKDIEDWANAIEGRDDISFESNSENIIGEILFELANPLLTQPLSEQRALLLASRL
jgi:hypothetical protein